jgi:DNA-binding Xre family transcriptional regulator
VKEGTARARGEELKRLEARTKMKGDARTEAATRSAEDGIGTVQTPALNQAPTAEIAVAGKGGSGATPIPQFPNRVSWLKARLLERGWSNSDPSNHRGPDRKTIERILRGEAVRNDILKKLAEALSTKPPKVSVEDIPQD